MRQIVIKRAKKKMCAKGGENKPETAVSPTRSRGAGKGKD